MVEGGVLSLSLIKRVAPGWTIYIAMLGCAALLASSMITYIQRLRVLKDFER
jgi:hypothetical protein